MALVEVIQGSAEWLQMRVGLVTASRMCDVMAKLKNGGESAKRRDYKADLICEMLTGLAADNYVSPAMQWGLDNEIYARNAYEVEVDYTEPGGFAIHPSIPRFGASPDGLVGCKGLVEFKCPTTATHLGYITEGIVPLEYHWQMLAEMACAERDWCDFVSYDPRLPKKFQLFIRRFNRDESRIKEMEEEVFKFLEEAVAQVKALAEVQLIDVPASVGERKKPEREEVPSAVPKAVIMPFTPSAEAEAEFKKMYPDDEWNKGVSFNDAP